MTHPCTRIVYRNAPNIRDMQSAIAAFLPMFHTGSHVELPEYETHRETCQEYWTEQLLVGYVARILNSACRGELGSLLRMHGPVTFAYQSPLPGEPSRRIPPPTLDVLIYNEGFVLPHGKTPLMLDLQCIASRSLETAPPPDSRTKRAIAPLSRDDFEVWTTPLRLPYEEAITLTYHFFRSPPVDACLHWLGRRKLLTALPMLRFDPDSSGVGRYCISHGPASSLLIYNDADL